MGRATALLVGLLACLTQLTPGAATPGTAAVTVILAAVLVAALITRRQLSQPFLTVEGTPTWRRLPAEGTRQYVPAAAGRPQPRAPGRCGS